MIKLVCIYISSANYIVASKIPEVQVKSLHLATNRSERQYLLLCEQLTEQTVPLHLQNVTPTCTLLRATV